jgi:hypothetical protein
MASIRLHIGKIESEFGILSSQPLSKFFFLKKNAIRTSCVRMSLTAFRIPTLSNAQHSLYVVILFKFITSTIGSAFPIFNNPESD